MWFHVLVDWLILLPTVHLASSQHLVDFEHLCSGIDCHGDSHPVQDVSCMWSFVGLQMPFVAFSHVQLKL